MKDITKRRLLAAVLAAGFTGGASASGFALIEQSASGQGNAYAGAAATAEDASTIYFNPAGLTALPQGKQVVVALHAIHPSAKLQNNGSLSAAGIVTFTHSGLGGDAGSLSWVPNGYLAMSLGPKWSIGIGLNAPFGLKTEYDDGWIGRFQGIKSELKTININPTVAYKASDKLSLGFGLDYQRIEATLTKAVNYTAIVAAQNAGAAVAAGNVEGRNELTGDDDGWGYNLGLTYDLSERTRLGLAYRSTVKYHLTGTHTATHPTTVSGAANTIINTNPGTLNQNISVDIEVPDTFSMSTAHKLNDKWDVLGDLSWTGWSSIQEIRIKFTEAGAADDVTTWKLKDTWRLSLGANYRHADDLKFRFGVAYDQSPVPDPYRTVRLPDSDRTWLSVGMQYKPSKQSAIDVGFSYLWVKDPSINNNGEVSANARGLVKGSYDNSVRILSAQYSHSF